MIVGALVRLSLPWGAPADGLVVEVREAEILGWSVGLEKKEGLGKGVGF